MTPSFSGSGVPPRLPVSRTWRPLRVSDVIADAGVDDAAGRDAQQWTGATTRAEFEDAPACASSSDHLLTVRNARVSDEPAVSAKKRSRSHLVTARARC